MSFKHTTEVILNSQDPNNYTLWLKNHPIILSQKELNVLYLALRPHRKTEFDPEPPENGAVPI